MTRSQGLQAQAIYRFFHAGDEEVQALRGVSLTVAPGELVAVVGPSGSGKSTLLHCLTGVDEPDGGTVWLSGERLSRRSEAERAALRAARIGVLFQTGNLVAHLGVAANLSLAQRIAGRRDPERIATLLAGLGLHHRAQSLPSQLSGGELARAGLAVALANDPDVLVADEPTGELDAVNERGVLGLLQERTADGLAVVVATHSPAVADAATRVVRLTDGVVAA